MPWTPNPAWTSALTLLPICTMQSALPPKALLASTDIYLSHGRLQHHKPALADPEDRRNSPPAALPARQQSLARTETNGGATEAREEKPSICALPFSSSRGRQEDSASEFGGGEHWAVSHQRAQEPSQIRLPTQLPPESSSCSRGAASPPAPPVSPRSATGRSTSSLCWTPQTGRMIIAHRLHPTWLQNPPTRAVKPEGSWMDSRSVKPSLAVWPVLVSDALFLNMVSCVLALQMIASKKRNQTLHFPTLWQKAAQDPQDQVNTLSSQCWNGPKQHSYMGGIWLVFLEILIFCQCQSHVSQNGHSKIFLHNLRYM